MIEGNAVAKVKKVSYKFDIVFVLVFLTISIAFTLHVRYLEYKGGLENLPGGGLLPMIGYAMVEILLLLLFSVRFFLEYLSTRTITQTLIKITFTIIPIIIFLGSLMIAIPLPRAFVKGFEKWVAKEVDIKAIQQWLVTEGRRYKGQSYSYRYEFPKEFPTCLTGFKPMYISFDTSELDGSLYIELSWGGGFSSSWGIRIGPPSKKIPEEGGVRIRKSYSEYRRPIAPGVYIFDGG